jgi:type II secretory pathway component PulK
MIIIKASSDQRRGVALITCLVLMALTSALLVSVVVQELSTRKKFEQINLETKVQNLAMSAQEIVLGFLLEDAVVKIPLTMNPIPGSKVSLKVLETSKSSYTVEIDAEYTPQNKKPVRSTLSGSFLIKSQDGKRVALSVGK